LSAEHAASSNCVTRVAAHAYHVFVVHLVGSYAVAQADGFTDLQTIFHELSTCMEWCESSFHGATWTWMMMSKTLDMTSSGSLWDEIYSSPLFAFCWARNYTWKNDHFRSCAHAVGHGITWRIALDNRLFKITSCTPCEMPLYTQATLQLNSTHFWTALNLCATATMRDALICAGGVQHSFSRYSVPLFQLIARGYGKLQDWCGSVTQSLKNFCSE